MRLGRSISPVLKTDLPTNAQRGRAEFALTATLSAKSQANAHWHSTPWKHAAMDSHTTTRDWARVGWPSARPSSSPSRSLLDSKGACAFGSKRRSRASDAPDALEKVAQDSWYEFSSPSSRLRRLPGPHGCRCRLQVCHSEFERQGVPPTPMSPCLRFSNHAANALGGAHRVHMSIRLPVETRLTMRVYQHTTHERGPGNGSRKN